MLANPLQFSVCFVLCSLEFSIGPIVLYVVFWMVHLATVSCWYRRKLDGSAKQSSYIREVSFVRDVHSTDDSLEIGDPGHAGDLDAMKSDLDAGELDQMEAQNVTIEHCNSNYFGRSSKKDFFTDLKSGDITVMENPVAATRPPRSSATKPNTSAKNKPKRATTWFKVQAADRDVVQTDHRNDRDNGSNATDMVAVSPRAQAASRAKKSTKQSATTSHTKVKDSAKQRDQEWHAIQQRHATERNELKNSTGSRADRARSAAHPQSLKKADVSSTNHYARTVAATRKEQLRKSPRSTRKEGPPSPPTTKGTFGSNDTSSMQNQFHDRAEKRRAARQARIGARSPRSHVSKAEHTISM